MGFVLETLCIKGTRVMHLRCPSVSASSYSSAFWSTGQLQVTPGRWLHFHKFQGSSGEKLKPVPRPREKAGRDQRWWMLVSVGVGLAVLGTRTAQKAVSDRSCTARTDGEDPASQHARAKGHQCTQCPSQGSWRSLQAACMGTARPCLGDNRLTQGL